MFVKTTTHNRIVAEKDAEIAGLMKRLEQSKSAIVFQADAARYYGKRVTELTARLAPFTTPRARDDKGRFIKDYAR